MERAPLETDDEDSARKRRKTARWLIAALVVAGLHLGLFSLLAITRPEVLPVDSRVIDVILFRPTPPPPPPVIEPDPAPDAGGGAPASGAGSGSGAVFVRGASNREILALVPPEARRQRVAGRSEVSCVVRADTRLEACRIVREQPPGFGFGDAAIRVAEGYFRFRPPTDASGRPVEDFRVIVSVPFGRQSN